MNKKIFYNAIDLVLLFILILIDQYTKFIATTFFKGRKEIKILDDIFEFYYIENRGAAFGILQDKNLFLIIIAIIIITIIIFYYLHSAHVINSSLFRISIVFLLSGIVSNFIDRFNNNYIIDFLYIKLINFPVFNIADIYIIFSISIIFIMILLKKIKI